MATTLSLFSDIKVLKSFRYDSGSGMKSLHRVGWHPTVENNRAENYIISYKEFKN